MMKDTKKTSRIRRQRGYSFEKHVVAKLIHLNYQAKRLGSPSTELPDVFGIKYDNVVAIECKSTSGKYAYVPEDQIQRCIDWVNMFGKYEQEVILAFKFKSIPGQRKLRYHYKIYPHERYDAMDIRCDYEGNISHDRLHTISMTDIEFDIKSVGC